MKVVKGILGSLIAAGAVVAMSSAQAAEIRYDTWSTNEGISGNYILTVDDDGGRFNFDLTVDPWNAEALGLFVDFGENPLDGDWVSDDLDIQGDASVTGSWVNVTDGSCGSGCEMKNLLKNTGVEFDNTWDMVFRFTDTGFQGVQSFNWSTAMLGSSLDDFGVVAVRAQNLCSGDDVLETGEGGDEGCGGSDKSFGFGAPVTVPEPGMLGLMGLGLLMLAFRRRNKVA